MKNAYHYESYIRELDLICDEKVKETSFILNTSKLISIENYLWKVRAVNANGFGEFSEENAFYFSNDNEVLTNTGIPQNYGSIIIAETVFPEGKGSNINVYIPPIINDSNSINTDEWKDIWQAIGTSTDGRVIADFSPSEAANPEAAAVHGFIALLSAVEQGQVYEPINITIQKNAKNEFRAIIKLGCNSEEFFNTMSALVNLTQWQPSRAILLHLHLILTNKFRKN